MKLGTHDKTGELVAIKILEKSKIDSRSQLAQVQQEMEIMKRLEHRNVIQLYEVKDWALLCLNLKGFEKSSLISFEYFLVSLLCFKVPFKIASCFPFPVFFSLE